MKLDNIQTVLLEIIKKDVLVKKIKYISDYGSTEVSVMFSWN